MTTVLIVDDSELCRRAAGACIEALGCNICYASDGEEALAFVAESRPDVVLTDLQMPNLNGLELVQRLHVEAPDLPVVLMTNHGNESIAVKALQAGASNYVPKGNLGNDLREALRTLLPIVEAMQERQKVLAFLDHSETRFVIGYEPGATKALISYLHERLKLLCFFDESTLIQLTTALTESITNAIDHGNLELDSDLREEDDEAYRKLGNERAKQPPYCDRKVTVTVILNQSEAKFIVRDDGSGFDPTSLPDPTDPENLLKASGRGIMLMQTFLDQVIYNDKGNEVTLIKRRQASPSDE